MQSQAYLSSAQVFARHKRTKEAELYTRMGLDAFPATPEGDPGYALDVNIYTLSRDAGHAQLEMGHVAEAYSALELYTSSMQLIPERVRMEIVNAQTKVAILENDRDRYAFFLKDSLTSSLAAGSKKRFDEACTTFKEEMPASWLHNREIQDIAEQYWLQRAN
ncbi:MAG TPA: hypothetical protein VGD98_23505 [Ktedonobacteraceae bacterium]